MIKRILASVAILTLLATNVVNMAVAQDTNITLTGLSSSEQTFDPVEGESTLLKFQLNADSYLKVYVTNTQTGAYTVLEDDTLSTKGTYYYDWYGTLDNVKNGTSLAYGTYKFSVIAKDSSTKRITDYESIELKLQDTVAPMPLPPSTTDLEVEAFSVSPTTIVFDKAHRTRVTFSLTKRAYATVAVYAPNAGVIKSYPAYTSALLDGETLYSFYWDGTDNNNDRVSSGTYNITIYTWNNEGERDRQFKTVEVINEPTVIPQPEIEGLTVSKTTFDPYSETSTIRFILSNTQAYLNVDIREGNEADGYTILRTFSSYDGNDLYQPGTKYITWDGKNNAGEYVEDGEYTVAVHAMNSVGSTAVDWDLTTVEVETDDVIENSVIEDFEIHPSTSWDPTDDELEVEFELNEGVNNLEVYAKNLLDGEVVEIYDDEDADDTDYFIEWEGTDDDDDYIEEGTWRVYVEADDSLVYDDVKVVYEEPEISDSLLTKDSIDTTLDEFTNVVFRVDDDALVTVELHKDGREEKILLDEEYVNKNQWYAVEWDGTDEDDYEADLDDDWSIVIRAENEVNDNVYDEVELDVDTDEDYISGRKVNVTNDYTKPVIYDDKDGTTTTFYFYMEDDAEVYLAVYKGHNTTGTPESELLDYEDLDEGYHTVEWTVEDDDDRRLRDGVYSYKLVTRTDDNYKDTEKGKFVIGNEGNYDDDDDDDDDNNFDECNDFYWDVSVYDEDLCKSVTWATEEGIFEGYSNGAFRPDNAINRAETLKVLFEAFDQVTILPKDGTTQGFHDVDLNAWYMSYVRTAKYYGMLHGYLNETEARLNNTINRVEMLKFALQAADAFTNYELAGYENTYYHDVDPTNNTHDWFFDYAGAAYQYGLFNYYHDAETGKRYLKPGQEVTRGEVAKLLYRMYKQGLLN